MRFLFLLFISIIVVAGFADAQKKASGTCSVIGYYAGSPTMVDSFPVEKLTHIIYSFCHLKGDSIWVSNARDSLTIQRLVALKARNPQLKVILSLGGWSGCETCSDVFGDKSKRKIFAASVKGLADYFHTDGIDLDWEYPAILGYPGHRFVPEDRHNFTQLVKQLRSTLGKQQEISFAAGGTKNYFDSSVEWKKIIRKVNRINLMSYDLVSGYAKVSGHHTPLYSTPQQQLSVDYGVEYLHTLGVPYKKITIGAAFYARIFEDSTADNNGLYQPTRFKEGVSYKNFSSKFQADSGFVYHWDEIAKAPYYFNASKKLLVTCDDSTSIQLKTKYAIDKKLDGIMFWQLADDSFTNGLLDILYAAKQDALWHSNKQQK